jgi:hypothetical protein
MNTKGIIPPDTFQGNNAVDQMTQTFEDSDPQKKERIIRDLAASPNLRRLTHLFLMNIFTVTTPNIQSLIIELFKDDPDFLDEAKLCIDDYIKDNEPLDEKTKELKKLCDSR